MIALALSALLHFQDPANDAVGNGSLAAPTAAAYRSLGSFDLLSLELLDTPFLSFDLTFAALANPFDLPYGFSLPVLELYLYDADRPDPGSPQLLDGSGMRLPEGESWHYAFRITGDGAQLYGASAEGFARLNDPLSLSAEGSTVSVASALARPERFVLYGVVGAYSPFSASGWQPLSRTSSPWSFSSASQNVPVVELLAATAEAQAEAIAEPEGAQPRQQLGEASSGDPGFIPEPSPEPQAGREFTKPTTSRAAAPAASHPASTPTAKPAAPAPLELHSWHETEDDAWWDAEPDTEPDAEPDTEPDAEPDARIVAPPPDPALEPVDAEPVPLDFGDPASLAPKATASGARADEASGLEPGSGEPESPAPELASPEMAAPKAAREGFGNTAFAGEASNPEASAGEASKSEPFVYSEADEGDLSRPDPETLSDETANVKQKAKSS